jgi:Flp pilus assembly protein TadD
MNPSERLGRLLIPGLLGGLLLCLGWLMFISLRDPTVPFLGANGQADWILFPKPPEASIQKVVPIAAEFHHSFTLKAAPTNATLSWRWFSHGTLSINGQPLPTTLASNVNWKVASELEVSRFLRAGSNFISASVANPTGPPALWLELTSAERTVATGTNWQASLAGATFIPAIRASDTPAIKPGNPLYGREHVGASLKHKWWLLALLIGLGAVLSACFPVAKLDSLSTSTSRVSRHFYWGLPALLGLAWIALFCNNLPQLAQLFGFDRDGHLQYIDYILQHGDLPLADAGWQMYQPPFFYIISSLLLAPFGWAASADSSLLLLRGFAGLTGLAHVVLIFFCLRELFPAKKSAQFFGTALAAFLPANLYLSHHVTNENLSALLVTAAFWCLLRLGRAGASPVRWSALAGGALGLAMLTKFSALLVIPVLVGALFWKVTFGTSTAPPPSSGAAFRMGMRCCLTFLGVFLLVCGWHYARVWVHFGNPLIGNWDPRLTFAWWQDPGFRSAPWFSRFGESWHLPLFSSLSSMADGLYSTLWTDGLCSGSTRMDFRPQWNYELLNGGLLLGGVWSLLVLVGFARIVGQNSRRLQAEGVVWIGVAVAFAFGLTYMALRVPSYGQVKFFYALPALLPFCVFATAGWDWLAQRGAAWRFVLNTLLASWVLIVFLGFWIRPGQAFTHSVRGIGLADDGRFAEAAESFHKSLAFEPTASATAGLASALDNLGRRDEARKLLEDAVRQGAGQPETLIQLGTLLALQGHYGEAVNTLRRALEAQPDHPLIAQKLTVCLNRSGRHAEAVQAARDGLRVTPYNSELHYWLATSALAVEDFGMAVPHLRWAAQLRQNNPATWVELAQVLSRTGQQSSAVVAYEEALRWKPEAPEILNNVAWLLAAGADRQARDGAKAVAYAERACELTGQQEPVLLGTLAAAYAQAGNFPQAVAFGERAAELATTAGQLEVAAKNREYLQLYYRKGLALP